MDPASPPNPPLTPTLPGRVQLRREQLMLDQDVQGMLLGRVVRYWFVCLGGVIAASWCWHVAWGGTSASLGQLLLNLAPGLAGSLLLLPLVLADILRASNRFVGPVHQLRNAMKRRQLGDEVPRLTPRETDFWRDLTERFNQLNSRDWAG